MNKTLKSVLSVLLLVAMLGSVVAFSGCKPDEGNNPSGATQAPGTTGGKTYTYRSYATALGTNWNPHTWETNADDSILSYISTPFCTMSIKDSKNGVYQWIYEMATSIEDVTKDHKDDLTKYNVTLAEGATADNTEDGYVFEIKLNPKAKWEDGTEIKADDYIYSMERLLDSKMRNYRSNLYWSGESAVAGGELLYNSDTPIFSEICYDYEKAKDENGEVIVDEQGNPKMNPVYYDPNEYLEKGSLYFSLTNAVPFLGDSATSLADQGYAPYFVLDEAGTSFLDKYGDEKLANAYGYIKITAENFEEVKKDLLTISANLGDEDDDAWVEWLFYDTGKTNAHYDYDGTVGCYKVDDYTIRYVTQFHIELNYFLTSCTSTWLVDKTLYEGGYDTTGELLTTNYCTSKETSKSYGPYKIQSLEPGKQLVLVQNENWYGYEKDSNGDLVSYTNFEVDGQKVQQYQTTSVVIDVVENEETAKLLFLQGKLTEWSPTATELVNYSTSERLYQVDDTYTMSFFFNNNVDKLKAMDTQGNTNSVVLSNDNFRKAMSLAIDRAKFVTATPGYKPAYSLMNNLYFYDAFNDPTSIYRQSEPAMQAICNLYGVEYGEGKTYKTLKEAYESINGFNLTEAKDLMKQACDELVKAGLYTAGQDIHVRIGWAAGAIQSSDTQMVTLLNEMINAALDGSGFGKITFEAIGNLTNRYDSVAKGEFAMGYGAWGGAAFYPFRNFQVYMDPKLYSLHEAGCWDPMTTEWTLTVNGEPKTMTCYEWANSMIGNGPYASAGFDVQLSITAQLEEKFLETYYRIPLCAMTSAFLLSYQIDYYTQEYNIMYDFGGFRLMKYNYDDEAWAKLLADNGNELDYN